MKKIFCILFSALMVLSTVSFAVPTPVTLQDTVDNFVEEAYSDAEVLQEDSEWKHEQYGDLVFSLDFDKNNSGNTVTLGDVSILKGTDSANKVALSSIGKINPAYANGSSTWSLYCYTISENAASLGSDELHGSYLSVTDAGAASFYIEGSNAPGRTHYTPAFASTGTYTIVFDLKVTDSSVAKINPRFHEFTNDASVTGTVGEWKNCVHTYTSEEVGIGSIRLRMISDASGDVAFDNIRLYYKPLKVEEKPDENEWVHDTYGRKLFAIDFETKNDGTDISLSDYSAITSGRLDSSPATAGVPVASVGRINPDLEEGFADNFRINIKDSAGVEIVPVDGDNALAVSLSGGSVSLFTAGLFDVEGKYTLELNYKYANGGSCVSMKCFNVRPQNIDIYNYLSNGNWVNYPYDYEYSSGSADYFRHIFYFNSACTGTERIYLDDIAVYYFDPNASDEEEEEKFVKLTLSSNGNGDVYDVVVSDVSTKNGIDVLTLASKVDMSDSLKAFVGFSKSPAGAVLTGTFIPKEDTTLYMLWKNDITMDNGKILDTWSVEYEYDESSGNDAYWSNTGYINDASSKASSTYTRSKDGYGVYTFKGAGSHSGIYDSNIVLGTFRNENIPAGLVKGVAIRFRYKNVPNFDCSDAYSIDANSHKFDYIKSKQTYNATYSNSSQNMQFFYTTPDMAGFSGTASIYKEFSVAHPSYNGEWIDFYLDVSSNTAFQEKGINAFRVDFSNAMWSGIVVEIDYIRFIGEKTKEPESINVNEIRTKSPMGIRFLASLKNSYAKSSASYGWIISRQTALKRASLTNNSFTYDSAVASNVAVLKGENYKQDREEVYHFDKDEANVYFTAMLYNIPNDMYEDVFVARPFATIGNATYYGKAIEKSMYDVACAIRNSGFEGCSAAQQTYIQRIIDKVEKV